MSSNSQTKSIQAYLAVLSNLIAGLTQNVAVKSTLLINGVSILQPAIIAQLTGIVTLYTNAAKAQAAAKLAVAAREAGAAQGKQFVKYLIAAIKYQFGDANILLPSFGIALPKAKTPKTAEEIAIASALKRNTRKVRNTMGPKQRAKVTAAGQPGITVTSPTGQPLPGAQAPVPPAAANGAGSNGVNGTVPNGTAPNGANGTGSAA